MKLFLIRHGQSENNALWAKTQSEDNRTADPHLTLIGKKQIEISAKFLKNFINHRLKSLPGENKKYDNVHCYLFSSFMRRAIESGLIISKILDIKLHLDPDIHENGGVYLEDSMTHERIGQAGLSSEEIIKDYPKAQIPDGINHEGWWNRPFEEKEARYLRCRKVIEKLRNKYPNENDFVLLVIHAGFYNYLVRTMLGLPHDTSVWFDYFNAAITMVEINEDDINFVFCNQFNHFPVGLIT